MNTFNQNFTRNVIVKKATLLFATLLIVINCSGKSEVTHEANVYSTPDLNSKVLETLKKGTVVEISGNKNHSWYLKEFIKIRTAKNEGYISPKFVVVKQDPEKSVFTWGKRKDYENFYPAKDKKHYKDGYEYSDRKDLSKEEIPLDELLTSTGTKLEN
ncbi:MAG: SH3 domain-containing protein [Leptospira sp.]|nr:SH3 domain-containing protein [Leptospira sp.]